MNVLLLSGYWPVIGVSLAIALRDRIYLIVPEDEAELAERGWADEVITFHPHSLEKLTAPVEALLAPLQNIAKKLSRSSCRIGFEHGEITEPASYAAMHLYRSSIEPLLLAAFAASSLEPADKVLAEERSVKTASEVARITTACTLAEGAFVNGVSQLHAGLSELEAADLFRAPLSTALPDFPDIQRADGFISCMSGPNSALAGGAYARSRTRRIQAGDLVLIHCNSYADGHWTDITRTYSIGPPDGRVIAIRDAVFEARAAALEAIVPGVKAARVDEAARAVLSRRGFGKEFRHSTGHGVGFSAINGNAQPRLHPASPDTLQQGMTFNVEPAVYLNGYGGIRHCDMVAVSETGARLLTPFQCDSQDWILAGEVT
jgi:Xaa-Pro aminopeptidase